MSRGPRTPITCCLLLLSAGVALGQGQPAQNRVLLEARLRSPQPGERIAALRGLKDHSQIETIRTVLLVWNKDADADVRAAAGTTLYAFRNDAKLRPILLATLKKEYNDANALLAAVYLAGAKVEDHADLLDALARVFEKRPAAVQALVPVVDFLGTRDDADAVKALTAFTKLGVFPKHFAFRRSVVFALCAISRPEAVATLVEVMPECDGEVRGDIAIHLTRLAGEPFGVDFKAWKSWWLARQSSFTFPPPATQKARQFVGNVPTYYGIPVFAKKVIFVIDTSGSMAGERIVNAKRELTKTLGDLPDGTEFNVVAYNSTLAPWKRTLQAATTDSKSKAASFVNTQKAAGATFTYDALQIAMNQQPEAVYILTDGKPTGGVLTEPRDILDAIKQNNKYRRTTVHVVGLDPGPDDGVFSKFLKDLAAQNWGQYRRVD
jgi:HEAT repeat protein